MDTSALLCTYAALILHDDNAPITQENLVKIITASGNNVQPIWASLFAKMLAQKNVDDLILSVGGGAPAGPAAAAAPAAEEKEVVEEKKEESEEESDSDADMGLGLFD